MGAEESKPSNTAFQSTAITKNMVENIINLPIEITDQILFHFDYDQLQEYKYFLKYFPKAHVFHLKQELSSDSFYKRLILEKYGHTIVEYKPFDISYAEQYKHITRAQKYNFDNPPMLDRLIAALLLENPNSNLLFNITLLKYKKYNKRSLLRRLNSILGKSYNSLDELLNYYDPNNDAIWNCAYNSTYLLEYLLRFGIYPAAPTEHQILPENIAKLLIAYNIVSVHLIEFDSLSSTEYDSASTESTLSFSDNFV